MIGKEKCKIISDLNIVPFLLLKGFKLVKTEKDNKGYKVFYFLSTPELDDFIQDYYTDSGDEKDLYAKRILMKYRELKKMKYTGGE